MGRTESDNVVRQSRWEVFLKSKKPLIDDWKHTLYLWKRTPLAMIGSVILILFLLLAAFAPYIAPHDPLAHDMEHRLEAPSKEHLFGTDQYGRDILSRVIMGSRIEVKIITIVTLISVFIGVSVGLCAGYMGGWIDQVLMRITDIFMAFPRLILAMAFTAALGANLTNTIIAISLVGWTAYARVVRAEVIRVKSQPYIEAIRSVGASDIRIMLLHVLPMSISPLLVQCTLRMGTIILTAAGLGFLGLGAQPPTPEWGAIVSDGRSFFLDQWWICTFAGIAIAIVVLGFNLLGDGVRDIMDPKIRR